MDNNEQTLNLNQNLAQCLQHQNNFGSTTIYNICNGKQTVVPWGSADWALCFVLIVFGLFIVAIMGRLAAMIWWD